VSLAIAVAILVGLELGSAPVPSAKAASCKKRVFVTFFVYSFLPAPSSNGCWSYERPPQAPGRWHICHWDKPRTGSGSNWVYDDTSPKHVPLRAEKTKIASCAAGGGPLGYEVMARRNGAWRKAIPRGVAIRRFYAETYSGDSAVADYFRFWAANRRIGRPVINLGPASITSTYGATYRVCRSIQSGTYLGIYSATPVSRANGKLPQVQKALNACTTR
jgi:hypothetical protein